jgi:cytohesin
LSDEAPRRAQISDERLTEHFFTKGPGHAMDRRPLTAAELAFIRAGAWPRERVGRNGLVWPDRWAGFSDVEEMARLVQQTPSVLFSVGPQLLLNTVAMQGCADAVKFLLDRGVPLLVSESGYNVLHEAAWGCCTENLRHVFESGAAGTNGLADPHTGWPDNVSLLYWAVYAGVNPRNDALNLTRLLLKWGTDTEVRFRGNGERGNTALQEAAVLDKPGKDELVKVLLERGAYYDVFTACSLNDLSQVKELARETPDIARSTGEVEVTPLHWAARTGAETCAQWLLAHGADVDAATTSGRPPLHLAADGDQPEMIFLLAGQGANLNAADSKGRTPLHRATYCGSLDAAEALIVLGADVRRPNRQGKTPLEVARKDCLFLKKG